MKEAKKEMAKAEEKLERWRDMAKEAQAEMADVEHRASTELAAQKRKLADADSEWRGVDKDDARKQLVALRAEHAKVTAALKEKTDSVAALQDEVLELKEEKAMLVQESLSAPPPASGFSVGEQCEGYYEGDGWSGCTITAVHADGSCDIEWSDGSTTAGMPSESLRKAVFDDEAF